MKPISRKGPRPLREARIILGLTQKQAAAILGVSEGTWQNWESGAFEPPYYWKDLLDLKAIEHKEPASGEVAKTKPTRRKR